MKRLIIFTLLISACIPLVLSAAIADEPPVAIEFERDSKRTDIITGNTLPEYTLAQRGSFQFFSGRLDTPEDFIRYFHDGPRTGRIETIDRMEKFNSRMSQWRVRFNTRSPSPQYIPRVFSLAVSFVPLYPETKKPERRVYILLDELHKIVWKSESDDQ